MKGIVYFICCLTITLNTIAQLPSCDGNRYKNYTFTSYDSTLNIQYGRNRTLNNILQNLVMDIYEPSGDKISKRPLFIFIHGGGFVSGSRKDVEIICKLFALRGFVSATNDYRLIDIPVVDSLTVSEGMIQAVSDAKAAIRFFVEDAATANRYKIDTTNIFIGGGSAGGVTAMHATYLDPTDNIPSYLSNYISTNGGWKGNSSNNTKHTTPIKGVINYSGALWRKGFISKGEPPLFCAHDNGDLLAPCNHGLSEAFPFPLYMDGSCGLQQEATIKGVYNDVFINNSNLHLGYLQAPIINTVLQRTADFLYNILCTNVITSNTLENNNIEFQIYPNPTKEIIYLTRSGQNLKEQIQIYNSLGVLLKEISTDRLTEIDVSDLPSGLYFIHPQNHSERTRRFIKE
jgi:para-nitrobenzyl esterase